MLWGFFDSQQSDLCFFPVLVRKSDAQTIWKMHSRSLYFILIFIEELELNLLGRVGIQVFSVIFLVFSSSFYLCPDILVVSCEMSFTVSLIYPAFLVVLEPDRSQGQLCPGSLPHPGYFLCFHPSAGSPSSLVFCSFIYMCTVSSYILTWQIII